MHDARATATMSADEGRLRAFLATYFRTQAPADDEDIFASGAVNSLFAMQLVTFIEREFGIAVENDDLDLDNFRSIRALVQFIACKRSARAADDDTTSAIA